MRQTAVSLRCLLASFTCLLLAFGCDQRERQQQMRIAAEEAAIKERDRELALMNDQAPIETGDPAWDRYSASQRSFQEETTAWIAERQPHLAPIARAMCDQQICLIDLASARYAYLRRHDPDRIVRDQGISVWSNFEWSEPDETALQIEQPRVERLLAKKLELRQSIGGMEGGDELRARMREWMTDPEFTAFLDIFQEETAAVEKMLETPR